MTIRRKVTYLAWVGMVAFALPIRAATQRAIKLDRLVEKADVIFIGKAVKQESAWNTEHTRIYTRTTFRVDEYLKGDAGDLLTIETPGGVAEGVGMLVPGVPLFRLQGNNLIFVTPGSRTGTHRVLGWAQGRFRIRRNAKTGRETLSRSLKHVSLVGGKDETGKSLREIRHLGEMKEAIRSMRKK